MVKFSFFISPCLRALGGLVAVVQLIEVLAGVVVEIERAVGALNHRDIGVSGPVVPSKLVIDGSLNSGVQRGKRFRLRVFVTVDGILHFLSIPVIVMIYGHGLKFAGNGRNTLDLTIFVSGRSRRRNARFRYHAHGRTASEHRRRGFALNADGHVLDVVRALVVPHHHVEGELLHLILAQRSQLRIFLIQVKRVGAVRRHGYRTPVAQRDAVRHLNRLGILSVDKLVVHRIGKQTVGKSIGGVDIRRRHPL